MSQTNLPNETELVFKEVLLTFINVFHLSSVSLNSFKRLYNQREVYNQKEVYNQNPFINNYIVKTYKVKNRFPWLNVKAKFRKVLVLKKNIYKNMFEIDNFEEVEKFILRSHEGQKLIKERYGKIKIDSFSFSIKSTTSSTPIKDIIPNKIDVDVYFTAYPGTNIGIFFYNIIRKDVTTDDIIFIKKCFDNYDHNCYEVYIDERYATLPSKSKLVEKLKKYIKQYIPNYDDTECLFITHLVEIRDDPYYFNNNNFPINNPCELIKYFPKQLYGIIAGDEGWRFVPPGIFTSRTKTWTSRDFFIIASFDKCVLSINFSNGKRRKNYGKQQRKTRTQYGQKVEPYFEAKNLPKIAGMDHGPFLILEHVSIVRFILDGFLENNYDHVKNIKKFYNMKNRLFRMFTDVLCSSGIKEIDLLAQNIRESLLIDEKLNEVSKRQDLIEKMLIIDNEKKVNLKLMLLTLICSLGALLSIMPEGTRLKFIKNLFHGEVSVVIECFRKFMGI